MEFKFHSCQISIFFDDGVMNPVKYHGIINNTFSKIFTKELFVLKIPNAPEDIPLMQYESVDSNTQYNFSKKRLNFLFSLEDGGEKKLKEMIEATHKLLSKDFVSSSDINRVGVAVNYYIDENDYPPKFWGEKLNLPFRTNSTEEVMYRINNEFDYSGVKFNKLITLTNLILKNKKIVPAISFDINNKPENKISIPVAKLFLKDTDKFNLSKVSSLFDE